MKIYYVAGKLDKLGFSHRVRAIECEESNKTYIGEGKRINKKQIMLIDSNIVDNHRVFHFYTYCLEGHQQEALDMLKKHIIERAEKMKQEFDLLYKWID